MRLLYYKPVLNPAGNLPEPDQLDNGVYFAFMELMDGERTADEIISALLLKGYNIGDIIEVFNDLYKRNIIFEASAADTDLFTEEEAKIFERQLNAFARLGFEKGGLFLPWSKSAANQQRRLKEAQVTVIGDGIAAYVMIERLVAIGIGTVFFCPLRAMSKDEEQKIVQRFRTDMYDFSEIHIHRAFARDIDEPFLVQHASELVIYMPSVFDEAQAVAINTICQSSGKDFVPYRVSFPHVHIGPFHIHGQSACYRCYTTAPHRQEYTDDPATCSGFNLPVGVDMLCVEVVKYYAHTTDISAMDSVWTFDMLTGKTRLETIYRQAGCALCGR